MRRRHGARPGWQLPLAGVALGLLVVAALVGHARLVHVLETTASREFVLWPQRVVVGLLFLWGIVVVLVVWLAPRFPAMPTVVAAVLVYGGLATLPILSRPLPLFGAWQPRMATLLGAEGGYAWQGSAMTLMGGAMTAAAVWGWWRHVAERRLSGLD